MPDGLSLAPGIQLVQEIQMAVNLGATLRVWGVQKNM